MRRGRTSAFIVVAVALVALTASVQPTTFSSFASVFWGDEGDALQNLWNGWWMGESLSRGEWPMHTNLLSAPHGVSLWLHTFGPFNALVTAIGQGLLPGYAGFNLTVLLHFVLAGLGAFVLARSMIESAMERGTLRRLPTASVALASAIAAVSFAFNSYMWTHLPGHLHCISIGPIAFAAHALLRSAEKGGWKWPTVAGIWSLITILCGFYVFVDLLIVGAGIFVAMLLTRRARASTRLRPFFMAILAVGLVAAPIVLATMSANSQPLDGTHDPRVFSADLEAFVLPNASEALAAEWNISSARSYSGWWEVGAYLGALATVFALIGASAVRSRAAFGLWLSGFVGAALSMGPVLRVGGVAHESVHLPYYYLSKAVPIVDALGCPVRFTVVLTLAVSVGAALGAAKFLSALHGQTWQRALGVAFVLALALLMFWERRPGSQVGSHLPERRALRALVNAHDASRVLDMTGWYWPLYHQTLHGHALVGSYTSRRPIPFVEEIDRDTVLGPLMGASLAGRRNESHQDVLTRTDDSIDFDWGPRAPGPTVASDFRANWVGMLLIDAAGEYEFVLGADDSGTLSIDGRVVVANGGRHPYREVSGSVELSAGPHPIRVQFEDSAADASIRLKWRHPGTDAVVVVPRDVLRTEDGQPGLRGTYSHRTMRFPLASAAARAHMRERWGLGWVIAEERDDVTLGSTLGLVERGRENGIVLWQVPAR